MTGDRWAVEHERVAREVRAYLAGLAPADERRDEDDEPDDDCAADGAA